MDPSRFPVDSGQECVEAIASLTNDAFIGLIRIGAIDLQAYPPLDTGYREAVVLTRADGDKNGGMSMAA